MSYPLVGDGGDALSALGKNTPLVSQGLNIYNHARDGDYSSIAADIADVGVTTAASYLDPLGALVGAGVGFLIDWVEPLHDMLTWVTGDPDKIGEHRTKWVEVGKTLTGLADELGETLESDLTGWKGPASESAKKRLAEFVQGVRETGAETGNIAALLALSASLMDIAMSTIKDLISQFVEWLIITWLAAQAAAIPSLGASEAAAAGATAGEAAVATSRVARVVQKVMQILRKLETAITKVMKALREMKAKSFWKLTGKGGNKDLGGLPGFGKNLVGSGRGAREALEGGGRTPFEYDVKAPATAAGIKFGGGLAQAGEDGSRVPTEEELNRKLNITPRDVEQ